MTRRELVALIMEVRDRRCELRQHACPGYDCATCNPNRDIEDLETIIYEVQRVREPT